MDLEKQYSEGYADNNGVKIFYHDHGPADGVSLFYWFMVWELSSSIGQST